MTNPTTPFNWQMPTSTDLVTDLPADFETFGQAVATSMADLLGGTTGQVLAKASNTDMDFTWVAQDDSNAIQNAIVDAKGDLIAATAADTPARLAVGTNGQVLTADSTASTGLAWATPSAGSTVVAGKNAIINGAFEIWQRGTSGTIAAGSYVAADRYYTYRNTTGSTFSRQTSGLTGFQYSGRVARDSGNTATANISVGQSIESVNSIPMAGQTVTLSFYAKAGANFSATSNILRARLLSSTIENQNIVLNGGTSVIDQNATLTTSWQRFSYSGAVGSTALTVGVIFSYDPTGTAGAADNFEITGLQVEVSSSATAFSRNASTAALELAACQRYYWRTSNSAVNNANLGGTGFTYATTAGAYWFNNPVAMRTVPTAVDAANLRVYDITAAATYTATATISTDSTPINGVINFAVTGATANRVVRLDANTTGGYLGFSAEL